jgi:hypothetical protein
MKWSTGDRDLAYSSAIRCTLIVTSSELEGALPEEWRLLWVAEAVGPKPLGFLPGPRSSDAVADVCAESPPATISDLITNTQTLAFCSGGGESADRPHDH